MKNLENIPTLTSSKQFVADCDQVKILDFFEEFSEFFSLKQENKKALEEVVQETISSISIFAYPNSKGKIIITCSYFPGEKVTITFQDHGLPNNPMKKKDQRILDDFTYVRENESNVLTLVKLLSHTS